MSAERCPDCGREWAQNPRDWSRFFPTRCRGHWADDRQCTELYVARLEAENARLRAVVEAADTVLANSTLENFRKLDAARAALDQLRGTPVAGGGDGRECE
jgi:hypothetical protein